MVLLAYTDDGKNLKIIKERFVQSSVQKSKYKASDKTTPVEFKQLNLQKPLNKKVKEKDKPSFDMVRASVTLVVASALIALGTSLKLPLSTTAAKISI